MCIYIYTHDSMTTTLTREVLSYRPVRGSPALASAEIPGSGWAEVVWEASSKMASRADFVLLRDVGGVARRGLCISFSLALASSRGESCTCHQRGGLTARLASRPSKSYRGVGQNLPSACASTTRPRKLFRMKSVRVNPHPQASEPWAMSHRVA